MRQHRDTLVLSGLAVAALALGLYMWKQGMASAWETAGFVTGVLAVFLTAKEHIWNWPVGLVNVALYSYVMYLNRFWSDAWLQVVYFVLGVFGWYWWLHGSKEKKEIHIINMPRREWLPVLGTAAVSIVILTWVNMNRLGSAPFMDASLTVLSLAAQYMLTRKYIESWLFWILVDIFYVPLFLWRGLYLTGILYFIFTGLAYFGLREWRRLQAVKETGRDDAEGPIPAGRVVHGMLAAGLAMAAIMAMLCVRFERSTSPEGLAMFRGTGKITGRFQMFDPNSGLETGPPKELTHEQVVHFQANAVDPLMSEPIRQDKPLVRALLGRLTFEQSGIAPVVYDVHPDHLEVNGRVYDKGMWKKQLEEFFR